jgi:hypothetical protein
MIKSVSDAFTQLERTLADDIGFCLFTVLLVDLPDVVRVHSSNPKYYPVTGRKRMGPTPWGGHVIMGGKPWLGLTPGDLEWAFPDHALIASLGCGCCISIPVRDDGRTIGTLNLLDTEQRYTVDHLTRAEKYADRFVALTKAAMSGA